MPELSLADRLEAVLFVATEPLDLDRLVEAVGADRADTQTALQTLVERTGGIRLNETGGKYRLVTAAEAAPTVRKFLQDDSHSELSRPAVETLAIVAYRGPVTKAEIDRIRGVASDTMLRNLTARGLIVPAGKSDEPGRPPQYAVSHAFLQHFGLRNASELPVLPEVGTDEA